MGFVVAGIVMAWFAVFGWAAIRAIDNEDWGFAVFALVWVLLGLGFVVQMSMNEAATGPCVQYETQMHYNPATKTMMPARVCVLRGEWVDGP